MKNVILFLSLLILIIGCKSGDDFLSKEEFTNVYLEKIKKKYPLKNYRITDELEIRTAAKEGGAIIFLGNAYLDYKKNPKGIEKVINHYMVLAEKNVSKLVEEFKLEKIIPVIKHRSYLDNVAKEIKDGNHMQVYDDYNQELIIVYAVDNPKSILYLDKTSFAKFNMDREELLKIAKDNLFKMVGSEMGFRENEGTSILVAGGVFESSFILYPSLWQKENFNIEGEIIVGLPARNKVLVVDSENRDALGKLKMTTKTIFKHSRNSISRKLFKWNAKDERFDIYKN